MGFRVRPEVFAYANVKFEVTVMPKVGCSMTSCLARNGPICDSLRTVSVVLGSVQCPPIRVGVRVRWDPYR